MPTPLLRSGDDLLDFHLGKILSVAAALLITLAALVCIDLDLLVARVPDNLAAHFGLGYGGLSRKLLVAIGNVKDVANLDAAAYFAIKKGQTNNVSAADSKLDRKSTRLNSSH